MTTKELIDKLIRVAEAQIGYLEKKSNKDLDDKTKNAGDKNYTKYNRDLLEWTGVGSINAQWCQAFVDWCFIEAFGKADAKKLIYVWTNYTPTGSDAFKKRGRYIKRGKGTPKRGDVIYFYSKAKGRIGHVGIVVKVTSSTVYTIEGNTSGASSLVTNGGGVKKKSYSLKSTYIDGYGSVDYAAIADGTTEGLRRGDMGEDVRAMQRALLAWNPDCLPKWGADGDFGEETEEALKAFQKSAGLPETGVYDDATRKALVEGTGNREQGTGEDGGYGPRHVKITGGSVNVRSAPGTDSKVLGVAHKGDEYPYQEEKREVDGREWFLIEFENQNGWVSSKYAELL